MILIICISGALREVSPSTEEGWTGGDVLQRYRNASGDSGLSIDVVNEDDPSGKSQLFTEINRKKSTF